MASTNTKQDIERRYADAKDDIGMLLGWLAEEVNAHEGFHGDELNYGHVGDLLRLRKNLLEALSSISGHSTADIETLMQEAK